MYRNIYRKYKENHKYMDFREKIWLIFIIKIVITRNILFMLSFSSEKRTLLREGRRDLIMKEMIMEVMNDSTSVFMIGVIVVLAGISIIEGLIAKLHYKRSFLITFLISFLISPIISLLILVIQNQSWSGGYEPSTFVRENDEDDWLSYNEPLQERHFDRRICSMVDDDWVC